MPGWLHLALLLGACAALLLPAAGAAPIERAEIYFLDAARAMWESGDWLVPRYRGGPFFDKPPLAYWSIAAAFAAFGPTLEAARLPSALAALAAVAATVGLGRLLLARAAALAGGLVLATTLAFMAFGRIAMSDMLLALLSTTALVLALGAWRPGAPAWALPGLGAVLGLGLLAKGPIAPLLAGAGILLVALRERRPLPRASAAGWLLAASAFAVLGLGWFALIGLRLGTGPLELFFLRENLERFAGATYDAERPPWYYLATYLAQGLPWSLALPFALAALRGRGPEAAGARLLAAWTGLMAIPLSLSRGKLDYYLLPLYPALSLVTGYWLASAVWGRLARFGARALLLSGAALVLLGSRAPARVPAEWLPAEASALAAAGALAAAALALLALLPRPTPGRVLWPLAACSAAALLYAATRLLPAFRAAQPNAALVADVARERARRPALRFALCTDPARVQRDLLFFERLAVEERCDLWALAASRFPFLLLVPEAQRGNLMTIPRARFVGEYPYLPATALTLRGLLSGPAPGRLVLLANYASDDPIADLRSRRDRRRAVRELQRTGGRERVPPAERPPLP